MTEPRRMKLTGKLVRREEKRNITRILVREPKGKSSLGRPRRRWLHKIEMERREIGWSCIDWIYLVQDRDRWRAVVDMVMNF
jgi:hypothetical protein